MYKLHSVWLDENLRVCQSANGPEQCGVWPRGPGEKRMAFVVGDPKFAQGDCDLRGAVGLCVLPRSVMFFYDGQPSTLEAGCYRMQGQWSPEKETMREAAPSPARSD